MVSCASTPGESGPRRGNSPRNPCKVAHKIVAHISTYLFAWYVRVKRMSLEEVYGGRQERGGLSLGDSPRGSSAPVAWPYLARALTVWAVPVRAPARLSFYYHHHPQALDQNDDGRFVHRHRQF